jgi:ribose 5-phosphate isomerase B
MADASHTLVVAADHGGFAQKEQLKAVAADLGWTIVDFGCDSEKPVDYPDYAHAVAREISLGVARFGLLVCGTGLGMAIAANKVPRARAVTVTSVDFARLARQHNDANIVCLSGRFVEPEVNAEIVRIFLDTEFEQGRHTRRVDKIEL